MRFWQQINGLNKNSRRMVITYALMEFFYLFNFFWLIQNVYLLEFIEDAQLPQMFVIWSLSVLLFEIPSGYIADIISRKLVVVIGRVLFLCGILVFSSLHSFNGIAMGFVLWGISEALISGASEALLFDGLKAWGDESKYGEILSFILQFQQIGLALGVLISGFLSQINIDYTITAGVIIAVVCIIFSVLLPEARACEQSAEIRMLKHIGSTFRSLLSSRLLIVVALFNVMVLSSYYNLSEYFSVSLSELGSKISATGILGVIEMLFFVLGAFFYRKSRFKNAMNTYLVLSVAMGIFFVLVSSGRFVLVLAGFMVLRSLKAVGELNSSGNIQDKTDSRIRATMLSTISFGINISSIILSIVQSCLIKKYGLFGSFSIFTMATFGFVVLFVAISVLLRNSVATRKR